MAQAVSCPERSRLQQFLLGRVSAAEADQIESHLVECTVCEQLLDTLYSRDPELEGVTPLSASQAAGAEQAVIDELIGRVKQLKSPRFVQGPATSTLDLSG